MISSINTIIVNFQLVIILRSNNSYFWLDSDEFFSIHLLLLFIEIPFFLWFGMILTLLSICKILFKLRFVFYSSSSIFINAIVVFTLPSQILSQLCQISAWKTTMMMKRVPLAKSIYVLKDGCDSNTSYDCCFISSPGISSFISNF